MIDLAVLPPPRVIEEPEFQEIFDALIARHKALDPKYAYYTAADPIVELMQAIAYREMVWRNKANAVAMSRLLAFAEGGDLDHLGSFAYPPVERLTVQEEDLNAKPPKVEILESDEAYRTRIRLKLASPSTAGPIEHYQYWARTASPLVKDVCVYSPDFPNGFNMGGRVNITILSSLGNGIPSGGLLQAVEQVVKADNIGVLTDLITVEAARLKDITVRASVILYPTTPVALFNALQPAFVAAFAKVQALGVPLTPSWIMAQLHRDGVQKVTLTEPTNEVHVEPYEYPSIGTLDIAFGGFYYGVQFDPADLAITKLYNEVYGFYRAFAIRNKRSAPNIMVDLSYTPKAGVIQPTLVGFATFLGIKKLMDGEGVALPADEIAIAIHFVLSRDYDNVLA